MSHSKHSLEDSSDAYTLDEDVQLMLSFQNGDKRAFEKLLTKYFPRILNFINRFIGNRELAEDLTQEVFIRVYKSGPNYLPKAKFQTWLYTIAKNICLNELRKNKPNIISMSSTYSTDDGDDLERQFQDEQASTPQEDALAQERKQAIKEAIESLPDNQRVAVLLRRYEQMSYEEISQTMGVTLKAVKSLLSRAKINLRDRLAKYVEKT